MKEFLAEALSWGKHGLYDSEYALVPFGVSRTFTRTPGVIGWAHYRIFGIRIVKVQETKPWP